MSVLYSAASAASWLDCPIDWTCLDCAEPLTFPAVYWHGGAQVLLFHPGCAANIGAHLIADAREATLAGAAEPHWRRRLIANVRHRLQIEEAVA